MIIFASCTAWAKGYWFVFRYLFSRWVAQQQYAGDIPSPLLYSILFSLLPQPLFFFIFRCLTPLPYSALNFHLSSSYRQNLKVWPHINLLY
jgi:hypothetical protein